MRWMMVRVMADSLKNEVRRGLRLFYKTSSCRGISKPLGIQLSKGDGTAPGPYVLSDGSKVRYHVILDLRKA